MKNLIMKSLIAFFVISTTVMAYDLSNQPYDQNEENIVKMGEDRVKSMEYTHQMIQDHVDRLSKGDF